MFDSLFSLHCSQLSHVLVLAPEKEEQERMKASGHRLKSVLQPLEDGIRSGPCRCDVGVGVRYMRGKSFPFSGTVLEQHPPTTLPLNFWQGSLKGCQSLA